ncbi:hypothetical protein HHL21_13605 [Massilia sp. RP-1-19]|uniref:Secreted protein n=1 Tax=Massilia polaris TaxID=2728846 RepID=A0A848HLJ5_9BURK|nr:hypothetical protein [Massilia polaris]NML62094.1 hypothetical protein [Massilia polaris]
MGFAKIVTILSVALATAGGPALAQQATAQAKAPEALPLKPDPSKLKKPPLKRRSVQQRIERVPTPAPVVTDGYRPTLNPRGPIIAGQPVPALPPPSPPMPSQINSCDGGGCTDTSGARYTGGVGNTVLDQNGRSCTRTGTTVQCF